MFQTHKNTTVLTALYLKLPRWAGTRRNIHPLTSVLIINRPLSTSSAMIHSILFVKFICLTVLFHNLCPGPLWSVFGLEPSTSFMHFFTQGQTMHIIYPRILPLDLDRIQLNQHIICLCQRSLFSGHTDMHTPDWLLYLYHENGWKTVIRVVSFLWLNHSFNCCYFICNLIRP